MPTLQDVIANVQARVHNVRAQIPQGPIRSAIGIGNSSGVKSVGFMPNSSGVGAEIDASNGLQSVIGPYAGFRGISTQNLGQSAQYRGAPVLLGGYREASNAATPRIGPYRPTV